MRHGRAVCVITLVSVMGVSACTGGSPDPSRFLSSTNAPAPTTFGVPSPTAPVVTPDATQTYPIGAISPTDVAPTATDLKAWTGSMDSSSNYTVTAQDGGLVCSAKWSTFLTFDVDADSRVSGSASTDMKGAPMCTHPEYFSNPMTTTSSTISGTATTTQLQLQFNQLAFYPAGTFDSTGIAASIYGINTVPPTITIPITSPGHAEGSQQLQTISGSNSYTSENTITLDCQGC